MIARIPVTLSFVAAQEIAEIYGLAGALGMTFLEGQLLLPRGIGSDTIYIFMHPTSTLQLLPMPHAMAEAGFHVLCANSRYAKNDSALIMEKVVYDLGQYVRHAREQLGYEKVVLVGWSGGAALAFYYQAQAEMPSVTHTPAGDLFDLASANLPRVDGIICIAAHLSRAETLTEWLDPSVIDELDPDNRNRELDIYHPDCPNKPPFTPEFVAHFRAAQRARSAKITNFALNSLDILRSRNTAETERAFVVHRTMCDVRWIDPTIDPNGRPVGHCYLGDPRAVNVGPMGIARYTSLRSWLSQWSFDRSFGKGPENAARIHWAPIMQIVNQADDTVPATHNPIIAAALTTPDRDYVEIDGASHYYLGQADKLQQCVSVILQWAQRHGFVD